MGTPDRYPALLDHAQDLFLVLAPDGEIRYANAAAERILGYASDDLVGRDAFAYVHPDDRAETRGTFDRLVESEGAVDQVEHRTLAADGSWVWLQSRMEGATEADLDGYVVSARDVTDRKRAEAEYETSQARLREIAEQAPDVLWMFTADWGEPLFVNPAYETVYGGDIEALREDPRRFLDQVHPDDRDRVTVAMERISAGEAVSMEYRVNPDREFRRWVQVEGVPIFEDSGASEPSPAGSEAAGGEVVRVVGYSRDVTDRRRRERQLLVMDRLLRHNLKNEMNVVLGHADLAREAGGEAVAEHLDVLIRAGEQLLATAAKERDLVDVLVAPPEEASAEVGALLDEAVATVRQRYPDATVELSMAEGVRVPVAPSVRHVFDELLENALEHATGDARTVEVVVERFADRVEVAVLDDGPPIPENEYQPLFEETVCDHYHGTGLGLTLACWIVDLVDGDIRFERREAGGNRVVLTLPAVA